MPTSPFPPSEHPLDVLIVGAGLSGIGAAYLLRQKLPQKRVAILEARAAMGGTWDLFRYPGVRSDSDMYTLGYSFRPWQDPKAIADGPDIRRYIEDTAHEGGIAEHIYYGHKVTAAAWSSQQACWTVEAQHLASGTTHQVQTKFLYMCSGYYSYEEAHRPEFSGESDYQGQVVLPQFWPEGLDYVGKQVVVVGSGATAMTVVPAMATTAAHVTMLQRSPTYVVSRPGADSLALWLQRLLPAKWAYHLTRLKNVLLRIFSFKLARSRPSLVKKLLLREVTKHLGADYDVATHFTPSYNPWDQRICVVPNGDLFAAIKEKKASVVTDEIEQFTATGLRLKSGRELAADIVVLATGLKIKLFGGMQLTVDGQPCNPNQLLTYKGMMLSDLPNFVLAFGYTNASWTLKADLTAEYVCRLLRYLDRHGLDIAVPRREAGVQSQPFLEFTSGYVQRAHDILPKQGSRRPWQVYQNYLQDLFTIRMGRIADGVMHFGQKGVMP